MDPFNSVVSNEKFSKLTLNVINYPKSLEHWENIINYLIDEVSPINKKLDKKLYKLIVTTYESLLFNFPYLENYYIDYGLFEYKLGNISNVHKIFKNGLKVFNQKSVLVWVSYLQLCNEIVTDDKALFKKYEKAEQYIGMHFYSGEFWELYLNLIKERSISKIRYFSMLRKILEYPIYSFSKFYAIWLKEIDNVRDLKQLSLFAPRDELKKKLKIDIKFKSRKGPYLFECKKKLKKITKEMYSVIQFQVLEIYSLFESNLSIQYYVSPDKLIPTSEIEKWEGYIDYSINTRNEQLIEINFQRGLIITANYDAIWIKYSKWLISSQKDLVSAKNILIDGLSMSLKKSKIIKMLFDVLVGLNDYDSLEYILSQMEKFSINIVDIDDFEIFWDFIQFKMFLANNSLKSRYSESQKNSFLPENIFTLILNRLKYEGSKEGQLLLLHYLVQLQDKDNTKIIENKVFKQIIKDNLEYYINDGTFWTLYSQLIYFDPSSSYLEKRRSILNLWKTGVPHTDSVKELLSEFCFKYLPDDIDNLDDLFA
ncbi:hypothetical protein Kpol_1031p59 [Vanderwaltozyma polyspora DSM 70294]|uniref:Uncharacterized protein n=1 Tax=Vanderwaltozyma polyspora (strain ATCC 22028 / DSM 70294 / BCRC 21397 / CBS 2163 / NBRC 10782 / NRRL Y-8283 / UCD 57-17) TaxID=436907 RepID=A7THZ0_VANPO|nr:uncharacterized protein Kpol_1031p59 [Vanderwaltozyma polyspora DSM 70294]EDO18152.1 hypothetical protein Kpol_1031p59 [Vanderwaltozyma polyspora DSM 70294]